MISQNGHRNEQQNAYVMYDFDLWPLTVDDVSKICDITTIHQLQHHKHAWPWWGLMTFSFNLKNDADSCHVEPQHRI